LALAGITKATATVFSPNGEGAVLRSEITEAEGLVMERVLIEQKEVGMKEELSREKVEKPKANYRPAADHPWRKMFIGKGRYQSSDFAKN
jgi:hypothetical protein